MKTNKQRYRGAILGVALIILLVLSFVGTYALQNASVETKITGNIQDMEQSLQSTESALREAENYIAGLTDTTGFVNANGLYTQGNAPDPFASGTWSGTASKVSTGSYGSVVQPRYFIVFVGTVNPDTSTSSNIYTYGQGAQNLVSVFRVNAQGTGGTGSSQVILESYYGRTF